jgi:hypothetical protein
MTVIDGNTLAGLQSSFWRVERTLVTAGSTGYSVTGSTRHAVCSSRPGTADEGLAMAGAIPGVRIGPLRGIRPGITLLEFG